MDNCHIQRKLFIYSSGIKCITQKHKQFLGLATAKLISIICKNIYVYRYMYQVCMFLVQNSNFLYLNTFLPSSTKYDKL